MSSTWVKWTWQHPFNSDDLRPRLQVGVARYLVTGRDVRIDPDPEGTHATKEQVCGDYDLITAICGLRGRAVTDIGVLDYVTCPTCLAHLVAQRLQELG